MSDLIATVSYVLRGGPARWDSFVAAIPEDLLRLAPAPEEWSAVECLQHLIDVEVVFAARSVLIREGKDLVSFDPATEGEVGSVVPDIQGLLAQFRASRAKSLDMLAGLKEEELERTANHEQFGSVSLQELLNEWAGHDLMHMVQAEQPVMQPFIAGCGKWRGFFACHDVLAKST
ncbi:MAG: DinB family protein [Thermomicrobiales bacterium]